MNENCLSFWFPKLVAAGVPVPRTEVVTTDIDLSPLCDAVVPKGWRDFVSQLESIADRIGYPCFLRTGQTSGKHQWKDTCYVSTRDDLPSHIASLAEFSECAGFLGLPYNVWAVRELLPVKYLALLERYGDMPLVREVRAFIRDGQIQCIHPYWPRRAVLDGTRARSLGLEHAIQMASTWTAEENESIEAMLLRVVANFPGHWSVDVLDTERGWYVTDMAIGEQSFHWPECEHWRSRNEQQC